MRFSNIFSDNDSPQSRSPTQNTLDPFLAEVAKSKTFFLDLSKRDSVCSTSTSDSGRSESSREELRQAKSNHQVTLERRHRDFQIKKKTELCKTFQLGMVCPYGTSCSFAHGVEELRGKVLVPSNYKTKNCKQYYQQGHCNYGPRCQFLHKIPGKVEITPVSYGYQRLYNNIATGYDYVVCNGEEGANISGFLNQKVNPTRFGLPRLQAFEDCIEEY